MNRLPHRILHHVFSQASSWAKIAGIGAAALGLLALVARVETPKSPASSPARVSVEAAARPSSVRTMSYYPEQLAALTSLASFQPVADAGLPEASPDAQLLAPGDARPIRHVDAAAKAGPATTPIATAAAPAAALPDATPQDKTLKLFGVAVPGGDLAAPLNDYATRWGSGMMSFGGKVASLWR